MLASSIYISGWRSVKEEKNTTKCLGFFLLLLLLLLLLVFFPLLLAQIKKYMAGSRDTDDLHEPFSPIVWHTSQVHAGMGHGIRTQGSLSSPNYM